MTKLKKNYICDKTKNSIFDNTLIFFTVLPNLNLWQNSKTGIGTTPTKKWNCDNAPKLKLWQNSNSYKTWNLKQRQNSEGQSVIKNENSRCDKTKKTQIVTNPKFFKCNYTKIQSWQNWKNGTLTKI